MGQWRPVPRRRLRRASPYANERGPARKPKPASKAKRPAAPGPGSRRAVRDLRSKLRRLPPGDRLAYISARLGELGNKIRDLKDENNLEKDEIFFLKMEEQQNAKPQHRRSKVRFPLRVAPA